MSSHDQPFSLLLSLPDDILHRCLQLVTPTQLCQCAAVSSSITKHCFNEELWKLLLEKHEWGVIVDAKSNRNSFAINVIKLKWHTRWLQNQALNIKNQSTVNENDYETLTSQQHCYQTPTIKRTPLQPLPHLLRSDNDTINASHDDIIKFTQNKRLHLSPEAVGTLVDDFSRLLSRPSSLTKRSHRSPSSTLAPHSPDSLSPAAHDVSPVSAFPLSQNLSEWVGTVLPPLSSIYAMSLSSPRHTYLERGDGYDRRIRIVVSFENCLRDSDPPLVKVASPCHFFHPNIDEDTGNVCSKVLSKRWPAKEGIDRGLSIFRNLLLKPDFSVCPLNYFAASQWYIPGKIPSHLRTIWLKKQEEVTSTVSILSSTPSSTPVLPRSGASSALKHKKISKTSPSPSPVSFGAREAIILSHMR